MIIDFHAHILPGADHGSRDCETTQRQLELIAAGGTDAVVATPHFYPHRDNASAFLARRKAALERLLSRCRVPAELQIFLGAEVQLCEGLDELEELSELCVQGTNVILLEMPFCTWSRRLTDTIAAIADRGFVPVLAHVDRYPVKQIRALLKQGAVAQLNAEAFGSFFAKRKARRYLNEGRVVAFGSDLHGAKDDGYIQFVQMRGELRERSEAVFARTQALLKNARNVAETAPVPVLI